VFLYVLDQVGTPRELIDGKGHVAWAATCKAWGQIAEIQRDPGAERPRPVESRFGSSGNMRTRRRGSIRTRVETDIEAQAVGDAEACVGIAVGCKKKSSGRTWSAR
jgi:hypothetical protein